MHDHLFVSDLMALRKRRANVARVMHTSYVSYRSRRRFDARYLRLYDQYKRTFFHLTVIELRLTDRVVS